MTFPSHAVLTKEELLDRYAKGDRNFEQSHLQNNTTDWKLSVFRPEMKIGRANLFALVFLDPHKQ